MAERLGLSLNLRLLALTQLQGFPFNSLGRLDDRVVATDESGIHILGTEDDDAGAAIFSRLELPVVDLGGMASLRCLILSFETEGQLSVRVSFDEQDEQVYYVQPHNQGSYQHDVQVYMSSFQRGRFLRLIFENVDGCDFSLDEVRAVVMAGRATRHG